MVLLIRFCSFLRIELMNIYLSSNIHNNKIDSTLDNSFNIQCRIIFIKSALDRSLSNPRKVIDTPIKRSVPSILPKHATAASEIRLPRAHHLHPAGCAKRKGKKRKKSHGSPRARADVEEDEPGGINKKGGGRKRQIGTHESQHRASGALGNILRAAAAHRRLIFAGAAARGRKIYEADM